MSVFFTVSISKVDTGSNILKIEDAQLDEDTIVGLMGAVAEGKGLVIPRKDSVTVLTPSVMEQRLEVTISETVETLPE